MTATAASCRRCAAPCRGDTVTYRRRRLCCACNRSRVGTLPCCRRCGRALKRRGRPPADALCGHCRQAALKAKAPAPLSGRRPPARHESAVPPEVDLMRAERIAYYAARVAAGLPLFECNPYRPDLR